MRKALASTTEYSTGNTGGEIPIGVFRTSSPTPERPLDRPTVSALSLTKFGFRLTPQKLDSHNNVVSYHLTGTDLRQGLGPQPSLAKLNMTAVRAQLAVEHRKLDNFQKTGKLPPAWTTSIANAFPSPELKRPWDTTPYKRIQIEHAADLSAAE